MGWRGRNRTSPMAVLLAFYNRSVGTDTVTYADQQPNTGLHSAASIPTYISTCNIALTSVSSIKHQKLEPKEMLTHVVTASLIRKSDLSAKLFVTNITILH